MNPDRTLPWDWYAGRIPENAAVDDTAYVETTYSFCFFRSRLPRGVEIGPGASTYLGTMFDVGVRGRVKLGKCALVHGARIICDSEIIRSEEHTSELQSPCNLVCRLLLEKKKKTKQT